MLRKKPTGLHSKADAGLGRAHEFITAAKQEIHTALEYNSDAIDLHEAAIERHEACLVTARQRAVEADHLLESLARVE